MRTKPSPRAGTAIRRLASVVTAAVAAIALSGCFMVPLLDGRSPFDDPSGASKEDVDSQLPALQRALDALDAGDWEFEAQRASDNCEGACQLRLGVQISPSESLLREAESEADAAGAELEFERRRANSTDYYYFHAEVPEEVLRLVLDAAEPVAQAAELSVSVEGGCAAELVSVASGLEVRPCADLVAAMQALVGTAESFAYHDDYQMRGDELTVHIRRNPNALDSLR